MTDFIPLGLSLLGGLGAGAVFFGGLWLTVRNLDKLRYPGLIFLLSFFVRVALVLGVFWWASRNGIAGIGFCFSGFLVARFAAIKFVRSSGPVGQSMPAKENEPCT